MVGEKLTPGVTVLDVEIVEALAGVVVLPVRVDAVGTVILVGVVQSLQRNGLTCYFS